MAAESSALTVAWAGGNGADLQQYQPSRDPSSAYFEEFKDLAVTVSRTRDLVDEAVTVTVTGMPGPSVRLADYYGTPHLMGANFIQAMQCWGDPTDPQFYKNCLYGAWSYGSYNAAARPDVAPNVLIRGGDIGQDTPFRAVTGAEYSSTHSGVLGEETELFQIVGTETTNERSEMVDADGTARFLFEIQSSDAQPYLGCGDQSSATGTRCWLVIVPRGTARSPDSPGCPLITAQDGGAQQNSPVNPDCDYWSNRLVVPLDFRPTGSACPPGSVERLVAGS
ncbi:MAG: hypothetical protein LBD70_04370 [Bifidobacteriaceae bacterium]|jgi:hypothetical protein|nr:hypothetical protein [Bifidobacteriaceae bacterium]